MKNDILAKGYIERARKRLRILPEYLKLQDYPDVIREAQEVVELALKGLLRYVGVEPPKWHDVSGIIKANLHKMPAIVKENVERICEISKRLRRERELAFYGEEYFIPEEEFDQEDARRAIEDARYIVKICEETFKGEKNSKR